MWKERTKDITPLLDAIIDNIPAPEMKEGTPQLLITSLEYSPYVGRIAVGKLTRGTLRSGMPVCLLYTSIVRRNRRRHTAEKAGKRKSFGAAAAVRLRPLRIGSPAELSSVLQQNGR